MRNADKAGPYVLRHGDIWFEGDGPGRRVCGPSDLLAVAYLEDDGDDSPCTLKLGEYTVVSAYADALRRKMARQNEIGAETASRIIVVAFPPDERTLAVLNWSIPRAGSAKEMLARIGALPGASETPAPRIPR